MVSTASVPPKGLLSTVTVIDSSSGGQFVPETL